MERGIPCDEPFPCLPFSLTRENVASLVHGCRGFIYDVQKCDRHLLFGDNRALVDKVCRFVGNLFLIKGKDVAVVDA